MENQVLEFLNATYPFSFTKVEVVTNEMYRCHAEEGVFFARVTGYKSYEEQWQEIKWTNYLVNHGIGASKAVASSAGLWIETITLGEEQMVVLFEAAPGIHLPRSEWNASVFQALGQQIGKMHAVSQQYMDQGAMNQETLNNDAVDQETIDQETVDQDAAPRIRDWHDCEEYDFLKYIPQEETTIRSIAQDVLHNIKQIPKNSSTYGIVHGDLWLENILVHDRSQITMIDFQDFERHYFIYDLAVPIYSAMEYSFAGGGNISDYGQSIMAALIEGYRQEYEISDEMLASLPLFMKLKELFEYHLMYMYWNHEELSEEQVRILNLHRMRLEYGHVIF